MQDWVDYLSAALTVVTAITAIVGIIIAVFQYRANTIDLKNNLYDRRVKVFEALSDLLGVIYRNGKVKVEDLRDFAVAKHKGYFLFGEDISKYLDTIYSKAVDLYGISERLEDEHIPVGTERSNLANEEGELLRWFGNQFEVSKKRFYRYLSLQ